MEKVYKVQQNIGKARYVVSFYNGVKNHSDGSPFYDIKICRTAKDCANFTRSLEQEGYTP